MEKIKVSKHLLKLSFKRRNPLNDEVRFRTGSGRHDKPVSQTRNNDRAALRRHWQEEQDN